MKAISLSAIVLGCLLLGSVAADHPSAAAKKAAVLMTGIGEVHHPVSTTNPAAQQFFDQGLALIYAFNHDEAERSFRAAAEIDPKLAMAHWGIALVLGSNYNAPASAEHLKSAVAELRIARELAREASEPDRGYIDALAKRYSDDPEANARELAVEYKKAMAELSRRYPEDLDAMTLYAESAMDLRPWKLWDAQGKPAEGTEEIVATLEAVLRRNPRHTGANHYYIHAVEASPHPEKGLPSADRLGALAPAAGHLVHMPSHIYLRTGDYDLAARQNELAITADRAMIDATQAQGIYPMMYYNHNIHFLALARTYQGRFGDARKASLELVKNVEPHVKDMPMLQSFLPTPTLVLLAFHRWDDILAAPAPDASLVVPTAIWHCARGSALAAKGKVAEAEKEREAFVDRMKHVPAGTMFGSHNTAKNILSIAARILNARIALAKNDRALAIEQLRAAVKTEDALNYIEPPDWYLPIRLSLGGVLLTNGDNAEAERVFREELDRRPRSGRALFGLWQSLKAQNNDYGARMTEQEFKAAWKDADVGLGVEDL
jgi:tetratricopeptide (TPR) repeat protein